MKPTLNNVLNYCSSKGIKLSHQQELILATIINSDKALTINDILQKLKILNPRANRMTIHRSLEHLNKTDLIHKIAFNHTYTLCSQLDYEGHHCQILVCQKCGLQIELNSLAIQKTLIAESLPHKFTIANPLEITGYCDNCRG